MSMKQSAMMILSLGCWLSVKWRTRLAETGGDYQAVAKQMKKQGYPLEIALALLVGRVGK
jgi:hypothetical protein